MNPRPDVSICIATHRRPEGLRRLFDSLARLKQPPGLHSEIVVVDNDPAGTARSRLCGASALAREARWFVEPEPNIALARNRAVREARGRWIAFIDDDECADENWLVAHWEFAESAQVDAAFGPVIPVLETHRTPWLPAQPFFGMPERPTGSALSAGQVFTGNAFLRRALFDERGFDPAWGRTGGSDSELFDAMLEAGARFEWCAEARVKEFIPAARHSVAWLSQRAFRAGVGFTRLQLIRRRAGAVSRGLPRAVLGAGAMAALLPLSLLKGRLRAVAVWLKLCTQAGHLWAFAGRSYEEYRPPAERC